MYVCCSKICRTVFLPFYLATKCISNCTPYLVCVYIISQKVTLSSTHECAYVLKVMHCLNLSEILVHNISIIPLVKRFSRNGDVGGSSMQCAVVGGGCTGGVVV